VRTWDGTVDRELTPSPGVTGEAETVSLRAGAGRTGGPGVLHALTLLGDVAVWAVLTLSLLTLMLAVIARSTSGSGTQWLVVVSNSMKPALSTGDLLVVRPVAPDRIRVGDIVTFEDARSPQVLVTHRVIAVEPMQGRLSFRVKGDNNPIPDPQIVDQSRIVGRVAFHLPLAGYVVHSLQARPALALLTLLPSLLVMALQSTRRRAMKAEVHSP